jgi:hypothetical protein
MTAGTPVLDSFALNANFRHSTFQRSQSCTSGSNIVPSKSRGSDDSIDAVQSDWDVNVDSGVKRCTRKMVNDSNYESKESYDVLYDKELVTEVPNGSDRAEIHPEKYRKGGISGCNARVGGVFQLHQPVCIPRKVQENNMEYDEKQQNSRHPTVYHIQPFIRDATDNSDQVVFAR